MNRALLELQELDSSLLALMREKKALDNGETARQKRDEIAQKLAQTREKLALCERNRSQKEDELRATETKIALQQKRLMNVSSAHEISALERDIKGLSSARGDLDEAILTFMDEAETLGNEVAALEKQSGDAIRAAQRAEDKFAEETARIDGILARKKAARPAIEAKLSASEKEKYVTNFKKFGGIAIAKIVGGSCSACGTTILPFTLKEAKEQEFPKCEACGRLLFVE